MVATNEINTLYKKIIALVYYILIEELSLVVHKCQHASHILTIKNSKFKHHPKKLCV